MQIDGAVSFQLTFKWLLLIDPHPYVAPEKPKDNSPFVIVFATLTIFCCTVAISGGILHYRRKKFDPRNYKQNSAQSTENAADEFSEVRFLTCDEQLDFTPQTPVLDTKKGECSKESEPKK